MLNYTHRTSEDQNTKLRIHDIVIFIQTTKIDILKNKDFYYIPTSV